LAKQAAAGGEISPFGRELRRLRLDRGMSLQALADLVHYSRGYLGKIELGDKPPTAELAHRCDEVFETDGMLVALAGGKELPRLAQLPAAAATFVGRDAELRQLEGVLLHDNLAPGAPRLVAIDGPPGAGKTATALRLAHQVKASFPDGQLYVNLHGYAPNDSPAEPTTVLEEFLLALGQPIDSIPASPDQRAALYRSLLDGRKVLLVLDNARDSQQILPLLPGSTGCAVLVTGRTRLVGLDASNRQRLTLGPLTDQESVTLLRSIVGVDRADGEPDAVRALAQWCGNLPLALRIAAERVATHPHHAIAELVDELADESERLNSLAAEESSTTVRAVFSWSYRDLGSEVARAFRLLGLHRGPHISVDAAAALIGASAPDTRRLLDRLVSVHLVEGIARDRYRVHDLLRVYAAERANAEESDDRRLLATRRMLDWYLRACFAANHELAPQRHDPVLGPPEFDLPAINFTSYDDALSWCETEMANLVAATQLAVDVGENTTAWKLPAGCWNYLFLRKRWAAWVSAHEAGLIGAQRAHDRFGEAWVLNNLAHAHRELRRYDEARALLERALSIRDEIGDLIGQAWSQAALAFVDVDLGHYRAAVDQLQQALEIRAKISENNDDPEIVVANRHGQGIALANLGDVYRELSRFDESLTCLHEALDIFREIVDPHGEGYALVKLGDTYRQLHRTDAALRAYHEALITRREIGDRWGEAETLHSTGSALWENGERVTAVDYWRQAIVIFDDLGDPRAEDLRQQLADATSAD
jgi:tetratricopeptide (TPR) repeat protein/transcriptional regulator with XRE-family HTH domain